MTVINLNRGKKDITLDLKNKITRPNQSDAKIGRNDPCSCGSEKKYKKCCLDKIMKYEFKITHKCYEEFYCRVDLTGDETLCTLNDKIQEAYRWDNDHMYSFLIDNNFENSKQEYRANPLGEGSANIAIKKLKLKKGQIFGYLFDYGDNHEFIVEVIDVKVANNEKPSFVRFGAPPEQYGNYE